MVAKRARLKRTDPVEDIDRTRNRELFPEIVEIIDDDTDKREWHVGREIPIAVIIMLAIQTGGGIWLASGMAAEQRTMTIAIAEIRGDLKADRLERYTRDDARRDREILSIQDKEFERRIQAIEQPKR